MNIVLINPFITVREPNVYLSEPLGLVCLASYLKQVFVDNVHVSILDLYALGAMTPRQKNDLYVLGVDHVEYISAAIHNLSPDLIGIACNYTAYAMDTYEVAAILKNIFPHVPIVIGGAHATIEAESIINDHDYIDYVIRNEGEITLEYLIRALQGEITIESVDGLTYRTPDKTIVSNQGRKLIEDLDILPIPDRSFIDMERYNYFNKKCFWYIRQAPVATIMTSRGCPYDCVFCSTKVVWQRQWRPRSLENVYREIELLVSKYRIKEFVINDDQFFTSKSRVIAFCDYFIKRNLGVSFCYDSGTSPWLVNKELLIKMRRSGFYALRFPIESGSEGTLRFINKPINLKATDKLIVMANKLGYWTSANFIIGFPYETREEINETIRYAYASALDYASFLIAKPNAGSELYNIYKKEGLLEINVVRASHYYRSDYNTTTMKAEELNDIVNRASRGWLIHKIFFYINPLCFFNHLLPKLRTIGDLLYFFRMLTSLFSTKIRPMLKKFYFNSNNTN
jgi:anaerobic magnesium-protoporphyrin IX monomethyl ester cyclase